MKDYFIRGRRQRKLPEFQRLTSNEELQNEEVWAASLVVITFLCLLSEMGSCVDPFARFKVFDDDIVRMFETITVMLLMMYLLVAADAAIWLNYITLGSLLIKPNGSHRYALYVSCLVYLILSFVIVCIYGFEVENCRGFALGWLLTSVTLSVYSVIALLLSVRDIKQAIKLGREHAEALDLDQDTFEKEVELSKTTVQRSKQLAIYLSILGIFVFVDLCRGTLSDPGGNELVYFMYGLGLKLLISFMLLQRKPIGGYGVKYRPFVTFKTGDTSSHTIADFKAQCIMMSKVSKSRDGWGTGEMCETKQFEVEDYSPQMSKAPVEVIRMPEDSKTDEPSLVVEPKEVSKAVRF